MVVLEEEEENRLDIDTQAKETLKNLPSFDIKSAFYNVAGPWKDVPAKTLENSCPHLLRGMEAECNFLGFEEEHFHARFHDSGDAVDVDDVRKRLNDDRRDPRNQFLSFIEIEATASGCIVEEDDSDNSDDDES